MKLLYTSDLHGYNSKYVTIIEAARKHKVDAVLLGGDLLPFSTSIIQTQRLYIPDFVRHCTVITEEVGVPLYYILGNDDIKIMDEEVAAAVEHLENVYWIDGQPARLETDGLWVVGMSEICDLPFEFKDRCRRDRKHDEPLRELQRGEAYFSAPGRKGLIKMRIEKYPAHLMKLPSLEEILDSIQVEDWSRTILVSHDPPAQLGLDITSFGLAVGSRAVLEFIERKQPPFTFHGHIHESFNQTGLWNNTAIKTVCIQPGQPFRKAAYAVVDTETYEMERYEE